MQPGAVAGGGDQHATLSRRRPGEGLLDLVVEGEAGRAEPVGVRTR
jgi:hypothetical protein